MSEGMALEFCRVSATLAVKNPTGGSFSFETPTDGVSPL